MAHDVFRGRTNRDWSLGEADLPTSIKTNATTFWKPEQMEAKLTEIQSKGQGLFGTGAKPTRAEAIPELVKYMQAKKIGVQVSGLMRSDIGSLLLPNKQQKALFNKIDDVRYDVRKAKSVIGAGVFALSGALTFLGIAKIYKANKGR